MALIDLDKFVASFITEMKECSQMRNFSIPRCIKKALDDQGLEYKDGKIVKTQRRISAEAKESGYGEPEDEKVRQELLAVVNDLVLPDEQQSRFVDWLEKQGSEPNWCHHKVDLSNCPEEYRKAYYDGWNNCNMQHSQCKSEGNDVVKCLINGMKFYYEDNEEATWGTEKFPMKVKDILSWLEKQGEQKPAWSEEDEKMYSIVFEEYKNRQYYSHPSLKSRDINGEILGWFKSLKQRYTWKPSEEQMEILEKVCNTVALTKNGYEILASLYNDLKKLKGE